jgi:signal transduction histidine kinase
MSTRTASKGGELSPREGNLLYLSALILVVILAVIIVMQWQSWQESGPLFGLLILFALVMLRLPDQASPRQLHLYLSIQTLIITLSFIQSSVFVFLFFILSAQAMVSLPTRAGLRWIAVFAFVTAVGHFVDGFNLWDDLINAVINSAGFLFFGVFGNALMRAETARAESQMLLAELQDAHRQLQAYAERVEALAVAEERNRLSREMHDTLGHRLTVSIVQLEGAGRLVEQDPARASQMIGTVRQQLVEGLDELRRTLAALRNPITAGITLPKALQSLITDFKEATHLEIQTDLPAALPPLSDAQRHAIYRTTQEALTNIQRHAGAQHVRLSLQQVDGVIQLAIVDDGQGFNPAGIEPGIGLHGMRERANQLHGALAIQSQPGRTELILRLPIGEDSIHV